MDNTPAYLPLLLLSSLLALSQVAAAQLSFTIDSVTLNVNPSGKIKTGTMVDLYCEVIVSKDQDVELTHIFNFLHNDVLAYSKNTTDTAVSFQLTPARAANSGTYECRVTVLNKDRRSITQKLLVTGLQTPVLQVNSTRPFVGEEVTATCSAPEEAGSLCFYFYQNGEQTKLVRATGNSNMVETRLEMKHTGDVHLHCNYGIQMMAETRRSNDSNAIQVTVKELFITPVMNILPGIVIEGDIVEFVCSVVKPPFPVSVFLTKDRKVLKQATNSLNHRLRVLAEDSGEYVCKAERGNLQRETYKSVKVKDLFAKPVLVMRPKEVFEGVNFTLNCKTGGHSNERIDIEDVKYSLFLNQVLLTSGGRYNATAHSSLNGNYSCQAHSHGRGQTQKVVKKSNQIVLAAKVPVSVPRLSVVGDRLILGKPFQLQCRSENGSLPITYSLQSPKNKVVSQVVNTLQDLAIFNVTAIDKSSDLKSFSCNARNHPSQPLRAGGLSRTPIIIEPVSKPGLSVRPTNVAEGQDLNLTCSVQQGTPPITYTWYSSKSDKPLWSTTGNVMQGSHVLQSVSKEHDGGYYCVTSNPSEDSRRSAVITVGVKMAPWKKGLIVGLCILLTVAIIIVIIIKKGFRPSHRKKTGDLSVKAASTKDETLRLTHGTANEAANLTPGVMGRNVWSENVSGSESDDQRSEGIPDVQYTDVQPLEVDPNRDPVKKGTDTVYSEVRNSLQGVVKLEQADGQGSVEYAQLNHSDHELEDQEHEP
ncbi:hypothetical protein DPEC_G00303990 [Dallia pectoralis]|uniref:Uncharacterized protein n=1 Tax=Dallia pectoralis TaxID=75939 RepID=A0ACC2FDF0_DALPE|nr:hypothetical protein DPEC_G00303990 [Dallia pectoralis]